MCIAVVLFAPSSITYASYYANEQEIDEFIENCDVKIGEIKIKDYLLELEEMQQQELIEKVVRVLVITSMTAFIAILITILIYIILFGVLIFEKRNGKLVFLAISYIRNRKNMEIRLPNSISNKSEGDEYYILVNGYVAKKYRLFPVVIRYKEDEFMTNIEKIIEIHNLYV